ncbi:hypothetical protein ACFY7C_36765 [Streptomyces sp. NPDC012769]|uniref:hypothetical protein n=1 Tax=Streptomyces sp. NPDC012769 TaxID=3364848 RepID=UPI0036B0D272
MAPQYIKLDVDKNMVPVPNGISVIYSSIKELAQDLKFKASTEYAKDVIYLLLTEGKALMHNGNEDYELYLPAFTPEED